MKNSKRFVLALLVIAIAFTSLNIISISKANGNPINQSICTAQGDIAPQELGTNVAGSEISNELFATQGDIKPAPWSDFYPVKKDDDSND